MRDGHVHAVERRSHGILVLGVAKAPQQAHGHGLHIVRQRAEPPRQLRFVERAQHAVGPAALGRLDAQFRRHHRGRVTGAEPVELRPGLAPELLQVRESLGGHQRRAGHVPLEQGVRAHGHAVHEPPDVGGRRARPAERLLDRVHHPRGLVAGRARRLAADEPPFGEQDGVGEGAAHVHAEDHARKLSTARPQEHERRPKPPLVIPLESSYSCTRRFLPLARGGDPFGVYAAVAASS